MSNNFLYRILLIFSLSICFIGVTRTYININESVSYVILLVWILFAIANYSIKAFKVKDKNKEVCLKLWLKYSMLPKLLIYGYTLILIFSGLTEMRYLSTNIKTFINGLGAICIFYLFGRSSFLCSCAAVVITYVLEMLVKICTVGFGHGNYEFHDLAFSVGYIFIFVFFEKKGWSFKDLLLAAFVLLATALAGKRIGLFALGVAFIWGLIGRNIKKDNLKRIFIICSGVMLLIICEIYVWFILDFNLIDLAKAISLNFSGREYYYTAIRDYAHYGIDFYGLGRNAVQVIMTKDFSWFYVGNIHSDILRMYVECGFVLFLIWLAVYLIVMPMETQKRISIKACEFLFICTLYTFIVYFTDNTELYLMNQYFYILTTIYYMFNESEKKNQI